jgi:hypothetical protein
LLAFLTDERAERLWSIALDEQGRPAPEALVWALDADDTPPPVLAPAAAHALDPQARRHDAELAARAEAERFGKEIEAAAASRLARICGRLNEYYEARIVEVPVRRRKGREEEAGLAEAETERASLAADLARRLAEEARRHQLRIQVRLLGQATLEAPGRRHAWRLVAGPRARQVEAWQDLATGEVAWPACERCGDPSHRFGLCAEGHLACSACLAWCATCGAMHCSAELAACDACDAKACARCLGTCVGAGRLAHRVCRTHLAGCPCCGIAYCEACRPRCPGLDGDERLR